MRLRSLEAIKVRGNFWQQEEKNRNGGQQSESLSLRQMFIGPTRLRQILQDLIQNLNGISNLDPFIHVIHWDWFCFSPLSQNHHRRLFRKFCRHMFIGPTKLRHILPDILQKLSKVLNNGWKYFLKEQCYFYAPMFSTNFKVWHLEIQKKNIRLNKWEKLQYWLDLVTLSRITFWKQN